MKIIFLTPNLELHGGNLVLAHYSNYLVNNNHEVVIISKESAVDISLDKRTIIRLYKKFPVKLVDFLTFQLVYLMPVIKLVEECDFIIPVYSPLILPAVLAVRKKRLKAKIIHLFQDAFESIWIGRYIKYLLGRKFIQDNIVATIAVSRPIANQYKVATNKTAVVIPNGIDHQVFHPRKSINKKDFILFVGRPQKTKGFDVFLKIFRAIHRENPNIDAKVIAPELKYFKENGLELIPFINQQQLAKLYNQALVYVNTSPAESFGLPALEAMASGTAVVLSDTVGSRDYAKDKINCLTASPGDVTSTVKLVLHLIKKDELRQKLEHHGIITAKKYQWDKSQEKFLSLLSRLGR